MIKEQWREIPGFPSYAVSDYGNVKRIRPGKTAKASVGRIMKPQRFNKNGYLGVALRHGGKSVQMYISRLVLIAFFGDPPSDKHHAAHNNGNHLDNRLENLRWATPLENTADKYSHGTILYGENHQNSKLTEAAVRKIRDLRASGMFYKDIGALFGITKAYACLVVQGKRWGHIA